MEITKSQFEVLKCLRQDARMSLVGIAGKTGYGITVCFIVKTRQGESLLEMLRENSHVNNIFRINNGNNYFLEAIFRNMAEVYAFSESLAQLSAEVMEHHIVETLAKEKMLRD